MSLQKLIEKIREAAEIMRAELHNLRCKRDKCKCRGYECCGQCGDIYTAENALEKADQICKELV